MRSIDCLSASSLARLNLPAEREEPSRRPSLLVAVINGTERGVLVDPPVEFVSESCWHHKVLFATNDKLDHLAAMLLIVQLRIRTTDQIRSECCAD